jgi:acyl-CoA synthetase (AMP-forming)/AMP-acid ligase II
MQSMGKAAAETVILAGTEAAPAEIRVKTPFMAKGYLQKGVLTDFRDSEGFFRTGDIGYQKDGMLYFSGREHDLVKKGGEFVSTQLIEDVGLGNPGVTDVAVVGVPDEYWGARVVLFYVPRENAQEQDILDAFNRAFGAQLRDIEHPDKIIPVPWMPKTSIGKIVKRELVDKYTITPAAAPV